MDLTYKEVSPKRRPGTSVQTEKACGRGSVLNRLGIFFLISWGPWNVLRGGDVGTGYTNCWWALSNLIGLTPCEARRKPKVRWDLIKWLSDAKALLKCVA